MAGKRCIVDCRALCAGLPGAGQCCWFCARRAAASPVLVRATGSPRQHSPGESARSASHAICDGGPGMSGPVIHVGEGFWNIRGSYKIGGVIDVGTQSSLARLASGNFVLLDSYTFSQETLAKVREMTEGGAKIEAVLNLHPFHTVHVRKIHEQFPDAVLYGTARHHERFADLPWAELKTEDPALHQRYSQ